MVEHFNAGMQTAAAEQRMGMKIDSEHGEI
jgi:hypothetical protein